MFFLLSFLIISFTYVQTILPTTFPIFAPASCVTNEDCADIILSKCSGGVCVKCASNSDCGHLSSLASCAGGKCKIPCSSTDYLACWGIRTTCDLGLATPICSQCQTSSDCAGYPGPVWCQLNDVFSNYCANCKRDTDCASGFTCNNLRCVQCASDADCPSSTPACVRKFESVSCLPCANSYNSYCNLPTASVCVDTTCVACTDDSGCTHITGKPFCSSGECVECTTSIECTNPQKALCNFEERCVECLASTDCTAAEKSYCSPETYSCESCNSNTDCSQFSITSTCVPGVGCVECAASPDCTNPEKSFCENYICEICSSNTDCSHLALTPACAVGVGCVQCTDSSQCMNEVSPYCNENTNVCEICHTDNDCTKFEKVCSSTLGCVECIDSTQCTTTTSPYCDAGTGVCTSCRDNNDCTKFPREQYCDTSAGTCKPYENTTSLSPEELEQIETLSSVGNTTGVTATVAIMLANFLSPGDSSGVSGGILAKILQYIKYINVNYSLRLEAMFKSYHSPPGSLSFLAPKIPDSAIKAFPNREVPSTFVEYNVNSTFIVNFWSNLISFLILSGVFIIIRTVEWAFRKRSPKDRLRTASRQIRIAAQNFLVLEFYNMYCDIVLFFSLQITRTDWTSFNSVISFFISVVFIVLGLYLLYVHVVVLYRYQLQYKRGEKGKGNRDRALELYVLKNEGFKAFFQNFKEDSFARQAFLLVFSVRSFLSNIIIVLLYESPLIQAALITSMTVIIFVYLLIMRPFKLIMNLSQHITYELLFLISNVCLLTLTILDYLDSASLNLRENLCNVIMIVSLTFGFIPNLFVAAKIVSAALAFYRLRKLGSKKSKKVKSYLNNLNTRNGPSNLVRIDLQKERQQNAGISPINFNSHDVQHKPNTLDTNLPRLESLKQDIRISALQERQLGTQSPQRMYKIKRFNKQTAQVDKIYSYNNLTNLDNSEMRQNDNSISFGNSSTMHILND